jgi:hypothetical protein
MFAAPSGSASDSPPFAASVTATMGPLARRASTTSSPDFKVNVPNSVLGTATRLLNISSGTDSLRLETAANTGGVASGRLALPSGSTKTARARPRFSQVATKADSSVDGTFAVSSMSRTGPSGSPVRCADSASARVRSRRLSKRDANWTIEDAFPCCSHAAVLAAYQR